VQTVASASSATGKHISMEYIIISIALWGRMDLIADLFSG
jgi:hypothetical protein